MPARGSVSAADDPTSYDYGLRRASLRKQREKGCSIYIPAFELQRAGFDPNGPPPYYRVWGQPRGSVFVRLYRER